MWTRHTLFAFLTALWMLAPLGAAEVDKLKGQGLEVAGVRCIIVGLTTTADGKGVRAVSVVPRLVKEEIEQRVWNSQDEAFQFLKSQIIRISADRLSRIEADGIQLVYDPTSHALQPPEIADANQRRARLDWEREIAKRLKESQRFESQRTSAPPTVSSNSRSTTTNLSNDPRNSPSASTSSRRPNVPNGWPYRDADGMLRIPKPEDLAPQTFPVNSESFQAPPSPFNSQPFYIGAPNSPMEQMHRLAEQMDRERTEYLRKLPAAARAREMERDAEHRREMWRLTDELARPSR